MKKIPFTKLPIYTAIRGCKLSRRVQNEVLKKLKKYYARPSLLKNGFGNTESLLTACIVFSDTSEGYDYWYQMHCDSGL